MAKIKWDPAPKFLVWNRVKTLRKNKGLNQAKVAVGADISIATLYMIEQGYDRKTIEETKRKLADFFECDIDDLFPAQMVGNITKEEYEKQKKHELDKGQALLISLENFTGDLEIKEEEKPFYQEVLLRMTPDELSLHLFRSGTFSYEAKKTMRKFAKKYGVKIP